MPRFRQEEPHEPAIELIPEATVDVLAESPENTVSEEVPKRRGRPKKASSVTVEAVAMPEVTTPAETENSVASEVVEAITAPESLMPVEAEAPGMPIAHKDVPEPEIPIIEPDAPLHHLAALPIEEAPLPIPETLSIQNPLDTMPENPNFEMFSDEPGTKVERYLAEYRLLQNTEQGGDNLFWAAMQYRQDGMPGKARQLLQAFIRQYATHPKVPDAQKELYWLDVDTPSESQLFSYEDLAFNAPKSGAVPLDQQFEAPAADFDADELPKTIDASEPQEIFLPPPTPKTEIGATQSGSVLATEVPQPRYKPEKYDPDEMRRKTEKRFEDLDRRSEGGDLWARFSGNIIGVIIAAAITLLLILALWKFFNNGGFNASQNTVAANRATTQEPAQPQDENVRVAQPNDNYSTLQSRIEGEDLSNAPSAAQVPLAAKADINPANGGFGWQFKYTTRKLEADSLAYTLRQRGYRSGVIEGPEQFGKPGYRVVVGQFKTRELAKSNQEKLPFDAPKDAWVVEIE